MTEGEFVKMMQPCINDFETINNNKDYMFHTVRVSIVEGRKYYHLENVDKVDERVTSVEIGKNTIWSLLAGGMHRHKHHGDEDPMKDVSFHDFGKWGIEKLKKQIKKLLAFGNSGGSPSGGSLGTTLKRRLSAGQADEGQPAKKAKTDDK